MAKWESCQVVYACQIFRPVAPFFMAKVPFLNMERGVAI